MPASTESRYVWYLAFSEAGRLQRLELLERVAGRVEHGVEVLGAVQVLGFVLDIRADRVRLRLELARRQLTAGARAPTAAACGDEDQRRERHWDDGLSHVSAIVRAPWESRGGGGTASAAGASVSGFSGNADGCESARLGRGGRGRRMSGDGRASGTVGRGGARCGEGKGSCQREQRERAERRDRRVGAANMSRYGEAVSPAWCGHGGRGVSARRRQCISAEVERDVVRHGGPPGWSPWQAKHRAGGAVSHRGSHPDFVDGRLFLGGEDPTSGRLERSLGAAADVQLAEDRRDVVIHRSIGDDQALGDVGVA